MAKIYKVSGYIISPDADDLTEPTDEIIKDLYKASRKIGTYQSWWENLSVQSADIPDWSEIHPLNFINCSVEDCEAYFK